MTKTTAVSRFQKLVADISRLYADAREAQVRFGWETGRRIVEEEQDGGIRAAYGAGLIPTLAVTLTGKFGPGFSERALRKMRQFYLQNRIRPLTAELDWTDHVELLPVKDPETRRRLAQRILKERLNSRQVRQMVRRSQGAGPGEGDLRQAKTSPPLKRPAGLKLHTYQKVTGVAAAAFPPGSKRILLDCGFFVCHAVSEAEAARVHVVDKSSYAYAAAVERVVDGDTLLVVTDLGFDIAVREKLRLGGIDTPELGTAGGEKAKQYTEGLLPPGSPIVLHSRKSDIYGRFVADVFYLKGEKGRPAPAPQDLLQNGIYLNRQLLDEGLAVRA